MSTDLDARAQVGPRFDEAVGILLPGHYSKDFLLRSREHNINTEKYLGLDGYQYELNIQYTWPVDTQCSTALASSICPVLIYHDGRKPELL